MTANGQPLSPASPAVIAYLQLFQAVIQRMGTNSAACKTWAVTLVTGTLVFLADKPRPPDDFLAVLPALLLFALDAYYLALERNFRATQTAFVEKLHGGLATSADLYLLASGEVSWRTVLAACGSVATWPLYAALLVPAIGVPILVGR